jgi:hypothetical protein
MGEEVKRYRNQAWVVGALVGMATALPTIGHASDANDNSANQRPTQEFNFRIDGPDQKSLPPKAPALPRAEIATRATPLANSHDIGVACRTQVAPEMPRKAQQEDIQGVVTAQIRIKGGVVQDVVILSGPPVFHDSVMTAMRHYKCISHPVNQVVATQQFNFKLE